MLQKLLIERENPGRVETGAVQFRGKVGMMDWPGLYLRGKDGRAVASAVEAVRESRV
jgi:hypothetical protein